MTHAGVAAGLPLCSSHPATKPRFDAISGADPTTFLAVPLSLGAIALLATYLPARRATRVDPVVALRDE